MKLDEALSQIHDITIPVLQGDTELKILKEEDFFYPAPVIQTQCDENSKFILFSAPGAVGKTTLAKHIASTYGGLYWDVSSKPIGGTSFAGEITHAVGIGKGHLSDEIFSNLQCGRALFVLDAFDEAMLISRREGVKNFILEIGKILSDANTPSVILTARTETAKFICGVCEENHFGLTKYDIDYFDEEDAPRFIIEYVQHAGIEVSIAIERQIKEYVQMVKQRINNKENTKHFIGYAQVLSILSRQVEEELRSTGSLESLCKNSNTNKSDTLIFDIIQELLARETSKLEPFKKSIKDKYQKLGMQNVVDELYGKAEQLTRLQYYIFAGKEILIDDYNASTELFDEDQDAYLKLLKEWLPQHVFLLDGTVMPIFHDYLLAESLLDDNYDSFVGEYEKKLPTRVFLDCYLALTGGNVFSKHVYYLDMAFSSQATTGDTAYCDIAPSNESTENGEQKELTLYLTLTNSQNDGYPSIAAKIIRGIDDPILLNRAENISVDVSGKVIFEQGFLNEVMVRKASIECDELELNAQDVVFEGYNNEKTKIIVHQKANREQTKRIAIKGTPQLEIDFPSADLQMYKRVFYELNPYFHSFDADNAEGKCDSKSDFDHAMKKTLEQFKVDKYDGDPAKHKEKIDARCHTGCKARVLAFLKAIGVIYEDGILYKANKQRMEEYRISWVAYTHQYEQLQLAYEKYCEWLSRD